jgi:hypothetical protein
MYTSYIRVDKELDLMPPVAEKAKSLLYTPLVAFSFDNNNIVAQSIIQLASRFAF